MKLLFAWSSLCLVLLPLCSATAQGPVKRPPPEATEKIEDLKQPRDYQTADLREALSRLGREAQINLQIEQEVKGTFTMKMAEPVTPFEALKQITEHSHLLLENSTRPGNNTPSYEIWAKVDFQPSAKTPADIEAEKEGLAGALFNGMGPAAAKIIVTLDEASSEYLAKPEVAARRARFYKNFYDALVKEGFTKEDALKMTLTTPYPNLSADLGSKK